MLSCAKSEAKGKRRILSKRRMDILMVSIYITRQKKHFKNEQRSRDAAAKKRANTSGVGKINNYCEDIYIPP